MSRLLAVLFMLVFAACTFDAGVGADPPTDDPPPQTGMDDPDEEGEEETEEEETEEEETEEEETEEEEGEEEGEEEIEVEVEVELVPGNPKCPTPDLTIHDSFTGTFAIDEDRTLTMHSEDGIYFDWAADFGIHQIIVKGGPNANVYSYSPAAAKHEGLHAPLNPVNGEPYGLSHVSFCYDDE